MQYHKIPKLILILILTIAFDISRAQVIYSPKVDSVLNLVSIQSLIKFNKELSGDTLVMIGGFPRLIYSRFHTTQGNILAQQYIYEKFQSFGLTPKYMINNQTNINVYALKLGMKYPEQKIIIGAHFDNVKIPIPSITDTVHGADDNASGVCAVLEAARLITGLNTDYSVEFVAFDEEENGLYGSQAFADSCYARGDSILGVINLDMIGWDSNNDMKSYIITNSNSLLLADDYIRSNQIYQIGLNIYKDTVGLIADHKSFWLRGFKALTLIEDLNDFNPHYHKTTDTYDKLNIPYLQKLVKSALATILSLSTDSKFRIVHTPIVSTIDTTRISTSALIHFPGKIATGVNAPRLYYKTRNGQYNYVNAYDINQEVYYFELPGQISGTEINYYIAAQDSTGNYIITNPEGGTGTNPPGTTPPPQVFTYYILQSVIHCSITVPKPTIDLQFITDTIHINETGITHDFKVRFDLNHTNDGDLLIRLRKNNTQIVLSQFNGENGQNYTGTIFDDNALISITQGTPPFTGSYRPQNRFTGLLNIQMQGAWVIQIYDKKTGDQGTLLNWCIEFFYSTPIGIHENNQTINTFTLKQNYPNPFNPLTKIQYSIPKSENVKIIVYDFLGREITTLVNEFQNTGNYEFVFDGNGLASGVYFYKLISDSFKETKKMLLLK